MSPRSDMYRQRAAEAKNRATQASNPRVKTALKEVARGWLLLAEQMEWMDRQEGTTEGEAPRWPTHQYGVIAERLHFHLDRENLPKEDPELVRIA
jgi:hypothetical protein